MSKLLTELNEAQKSAVTHLNGPCLIVAGAGTGKTKVLTSRIAYLISSGQAKSEDILALTFTEKATAEMEERLDLIMPYSYGEMWIKTFHSFADHILRVSGIEIGLDPGYKIMAEADLVHFFKNNLFKFPLDYFRPLGNPTKFIGVLLNYFSKLKDEDISPSEFMKWSEDKIVNDDLDLKEREILELDNKKYLELANCYKVYQEEMIAQNQLDYGDLISYLLKLCRDRPNILRVYQNQFKYILVDEYQDTNYAQNQILSLLSSKYRNIMVVGDDDQAIYRFRGASVSNILMFKENYPDSKQVVLTKNYRSSQSILDYSYSSIQGNNPHRLETSLDIDKRLSAHHEVLNSKVTEIQTIKLGQEVDQVLNKILKSLQNYQPSDIAILGRARSHLQPFADRLVRAGLPIRLIPAQSYQNQAIVKDLMAILRVVAYPTDEVNWYRVLKMDIWNLAMDEISQIFIKAKRQYQTVWEVLQKSELSSEKILNFYAKVLTASRDKNISELLFYEILEGLELFKILEKEADGLEKIQAISALLNDCQKFSETHSEGSVKDYIDYNALTEEVGSQGVGIDNDDLNQVTLATIHGVKGLEFKVVFVVNLVNDRFPARYQKDSLVIPEELKKDQFNDSKEVFLEEERRLFYVACTRAKEQLYLHYSTFYSAVAKRKAKKSLFLDELEANEKISITEIEEVDREKEKQNFTKNLVKVPTSFSYSQLSLYELCPKRYEYTYIYRIPTPPSAALSFGSSMHNTLSEFYKIIQNKQGDLFNGFSEVTEDKLYEIYQKNWISQGYRSKGHMEARKKKGKDILSEYYNKFSDYFGNPIYLEKSFSLRIGEFTIKGRYDRVDALDDQHKVVEIFDYKTGKTKTQKQVDKDLQLSIYALAAEKQLGKKVDKLSLYFLDDNIKIETTRNEKELKKAEEKITKLAEGIKSQDFKAKPNKFICAMCDYRQICDQSIS